jgi:hypothetical protein
MADYAQNAKELKEQLLKNLPALGRRVGVLVGTAFDPWLDSNIRPVKGGGTESGYAARGGRVVPDTTYSGLLVIVTDKSVTEFTVTDAHAGSDNEDEPVETTSHALRDLKLIKTSGAWRSGEPDVGDIVLVFDDLEELDLPLTRRQGAASALLAKLRQFGN